MDKKKAIALSLAAIILSAVFFAVLLKKNESAVKTGDALPDYSVETLSGNSDKGFGSEKKYDGSKKEEATVDVLPHYFVAIHAEPLHDDPGRDFKIQKNYEELKKMIARADGYGIKLTLMFTAQWADYIATDARRLEDLESWKKSGHEISAHHHALNHGSIGTAGNWDGYTALPRGEAERIRSEILDPPESYLGDFNDYLAKLRKINPEIRSGCANFELEVRGFTQAPLVYSSCLGVDNFDSGSQVPEEDPKNGRNDYLISVDINGINYKTLSHSYTANNRTGAQKIFDSMESGAYGAAFHASALPKESGAFYGFLEFLHSRDAAAEKSRTLSEIIDGNLILIRKMSAEEFRSKLIKK